jgi:hypothetical protein
MASQQNVPVGKEKIEYMLQKHNSWWNYKGLKSAPQQHAPARVGVITYEK